MRVLGWRGGWGYALPVALAAACLPLGRSAAPADAPGPKPPAVAAEAVAASAPGWVGSGRCSGRGCHGAVAPEGTKGSEFNTWATHDRHARAFDVLLEERSRQLERNLRGEAAGRAEADALCLACHDQPGPRPVPALAATGVGCESCHGAAGGWLAEHSTVQWRTMTFEEKSGRGLVPMSTAAERTRVCVRCHVGTAGQEVNHDLIAAGHPRLDFEAKAFLDDMPPHWDVADVAGKRGAFQAAGEHWAVTTVQTWAVGQIVTAQASLELLAARARNPKAPWPEFTEYGCFACHHDLRDGGVRFGRADLQLRPGALPWGTWAFPLLRALAAGAGGTEAGSVPADLDELARVLAAPVPDRRAAEQQSSRIARVLNDWAERADPRGGSPADRFDAERLRGLLVAIRDDPQALDRLTTHWDAASQLYLALVAFQEGSGRRDPALRKALAALRELLDFPGGQDSPAASSLDPHTGYDPASVRAAADAALRALAPR